MLSRLLNNITHADLEMLCSAFPWLAFIKSKYSVGIWQLFENIFSLMGFLTICATIYSGKLVRNSVSTCFLLSAGRSSFNRSSFQVGYRNFQGNVSQTLFLLLSLCSLASLYREIVRIAWRARYLAFFQQDPPWNIEHLPKSDAFCIQLNK